MTDPSVRKNPFVCFEHWGEKRGALVCFGLCLASFVPFQSSSKVTTCFGASASELSDFRESSRWSDAVPAACEAWGCKLAARDRCWEPVLRKETSHSEPRGWRVLTHGQQVCFRNFNETMTLVDISCCNASCRCGGENYEDSFECARAFPLG